MVIGHFNSSVLFPLGHLIVPSALTVTFLFRALKYLFLWKQDISGFSLLRRFPRPLIINLRSWASCDNFYFLRLASAESRWNFRRLLLPSSSTTLISRLCWDNWTPLELNVRFSLHNASFSSTLFCDLHYTFQALYYSLNITTHKVHHCVLLILPVLRFLFEFIHFFFFNLSIFLRWRVWLIFPVIALHTHEYSAAWTGE